LVTVPPGGEEEARRVLQPWLQNSANREATLFVEGGKTRQESGRRGLEVLNKLNPSIVLIHDGARPWVKPRTIQQVVEGVQHTGACAPVVPLVDALKRLNPDRTLESHVDRSTLVGIQTPQGFRFSEILQAHRLASKEEREYLDDTEIYHRYIGPVSTVPGEKSNIKITIGGYSCGENPTVQRIGFGYDPNRLVPAESYGLGGRNPRDRGEEGHSDGDVLIHAVIDALLGAASLGDIGLHFPPSDPAYKDISSRILLRKTRELLSNTGFQILNIDCTVVLEEPKLLPHREAILKALAQDLLVQPDRLSVKGKTKEQVDSVGNREAVEAYAVALLSKELREPNA
jgi:2-C-methyl-D-erythritol 4-phosphate cytidylyltransferase/2-C-methyl-D-erythritol 2,4-cyclodiphosphate synthase